MNYAAICPDHPRSRAFSLLKRQDRQGPRLPWQPNPVNPASLPLLKDQSRHRNSWFLRRGKGQPFAMQRGGLLARRNMNLTIGDPQQPALDLSGVGNGTFTSMEDRQKEPPGFRSPFVSVNMGAAQGSRPGSWAIGPGSVGGGSIVRSSFTSSSGLSHSDAKSLREALAQHDARSASRQSFRYSPGSPIILQEMPMEPPPQMLSQSAMQAPSAPQQGQVVPAQGRPRPRFAARFGQPMMVDMSQITQQGTFTPAEDCVKEPPGFRSPFIQHSGAAALAPGVSPDRGSVGSHVSWSIGGRGSSLSGQRESAHSDSRQSVGSRPGSISSGSANRSSGSANRSSGSANRSSGSVRHSSSSGKRSSGSQASNHILSFDNRTSFSTFMGDRASAGSHWHDGETDRERASIDQQGFQEFLQNFQSRTGGSVLSGSDSTGSHTGSDFVLQALGIGGGVEGGVHTSVTRRSVGSAHSSIGSRSRPPRPPSASGGQQSRRDSTGSARRDSAPSASSGTQPRFLSNPVVTALGDVDTDRWSQVSQSCNISPNVIELRSPLGGAANKRLSMDIFNSDEIRNSFENRNSDRLPGMGSSPLAVSGVSGTGTQDLVAERRTSLMAVKEGRHYNAQSVQLDNRQQQQQQPPPPQQQQQHNKRWHGAGDLQLPGAPPAGAPTIPQDALFDHRPSSWGTVVDSPVDTQTSPVQAGSFHSSVHSTTRHFFGAGGPHDSYDDAGWDASRGDSSRPNSLTNGQQSQDQHPPQIHQPSPRIVQASPLASSPVNAASYPMAIGPTWAPNNSGKWLPTPAGGSRASWEVDDHGDIVYSTKALTIHDDDGRDGARVQTEVQSTNHYDQWQQTHQHHRPQEQQPEQWQCQQYQQQQQPIILSTPPNRVRPSLSISQHGVVQSPRTSDAQQMYSPSATSGQQMYSPRTGSQSLAASVQANAKALLSSRRPALGDMPMQPPPNAQQPSRPASAPLQYF